jgi:polyphosphate kinase
MEPFMNRELSLLSFYERVLMEAADEQVPLLERFRFLNIYHSNLEEFYEVRVGKLLQRLYRKPEWTDPLTGWNVPQLLRHIDLKVKQMDDKAREIHHQIKLGLYEKGIDIKDAENLQCASDNAELFYTPAVYRTYHWKDGVLAAVEKQDVLLEFPKDTMEPFIRLLYEAANHPQVVSIQITIYRLAEHSQVVSALIYAAKQGKRVQCFIELRARYSEADNLSYGKQLEAAGCQVCYGKNGYKVHGKLCQITKVSDGAITYITQIGTGNYNEQTALEYTDLSLLTANQEIGIEAAAIFDSLFRRRKICGLHNFWVAPNDFERNLQEEIKQEIDAQKAGKTGYIAIKANGMNHREIMNQFIEASQAGVQVDLIIRGSCCLQAGVPGKTEQIRTKRVVGRYLEHSRIYCFGLGKRQRIFIGSGDLLTRNLKRRVEILVAVKDNNIKKQVWNILEEVMK